MFDGFRRLEPVGAPDHLVHAAETQFGHPLAHLLGDEEHEIDHVRRVAGEGVIPYARADVSYQHAGSLVHAVDTRAEVGLGPFGFEARQIRYTESVPNAALEVQQYHALYRMSARQALSYAHPDDREPAKGDPGRELRPPAVPVAPRAGLAVTSRGSAVLRRCWLASDWSYSKKQFPSSRALVCYGIRTIQAPRSSGRQANSRHENSDFSFIPWR